MLILQKEARVTSLPLQFGNKQGDGGHLNHSVSPQDVNDAAGLLQRRTKSDSLPFRKPALSSPVLRHSE